MFSKNTAAVPFWIIFIMYLFLEQGNKLMVFFIFVHQKRASKNANKLPYETKEMQNASKPNLLFLTVFDEAVVILFSFSSK